jgi:hypothetical protein
MGIDEHIGKGLTLGFGLLTIANLYVGASTLSERTGLSEAFATYSNAQYMIYEKGHEEYPWLFPTKYSEEPKVKRLERYQDVWEFQFGIMGVLLGVGICGYKKEDY